ncbi:MAG: hypothetical protein JWO94_3886 [Verrucomicrobiaceae bacterium]|nr:hypothetical protein [Verrucomicrobiaceae bacterium]
MKFSRTGSKSITLRYRRHADGFVLLEIILAIALFSMVAVSMTQALDQIARTSKAAQREGQVMRVLESVLAEVVHQPELKAGSEHFKPGGDGVTADASIQHVDLLTRNKARLDHMFEIHVKAWIKDGSARLMEREMKTYVYSPNSPDK